MHREESVQAKAAPIGLFDSGLGGLTVLRELKRALPQERLLYLGDTARTPYGSKSAATVRRYAQECAEFLLERQIKLLVIACNTASALALEELQALCPCPIIGTIDPAVEVALRATRSGRIGVLGTRATIASGAYQSRLSACAPHVQVVARPCPLFVPLVEEGLTHGPIVESALELYLADLRAEQIDTIILGCTHYPLLRDALQRFFGPEVTLVECSTAIASAVRVLQEQGRVSSGEGGSAHYFVTDEAARFSTLARIFLDDSTVHAQSVQLA
ncbi:MAG: glutamate racemase [Proteobacteria bacterium]|nr:glutamate racemase [Pseudomonadota bacterium]